MIASHDRLLKSWLMTVMHSVAPSASSWWIAFMGGLSSSSMSLPSCAASTRGPDRKFAGDRRRDAVARLPAQEGAVPVVLVEELAEERRAGPEHPDDDDGCIDALLGDVGVLADPVDDPQPVRSGW